MCLHTCKYYDHCLLFDAGFTGIDSSYEAPENPDLVLKASENTVRECVEQLVRFLQDRVSQLDQD